MKHNQMVALTARGETTHDLLNNLVKAYARVECEEFKKPHSWSKDENHPCKEAHVFQISHSCHGGG
jgi:hypothetical protein